MQVGKVQDFLRTRIQFDGFELSIVLSRRVESADQLTETRTVQIGDVAKVQKDSLVAVPE
jgi:hypothetical protein